MRHGRICKGRRGRRAVSILRFERGKKRPALVVAELTGDDVILCQITSKSVFDNYAIPLNDSDFANGKLHQASQVRPNRLFTAENKIILHKAGSISAAKMNRVVAKLVQIVTA